MYLIYIYIPYQCIQTVRCTIHYTLQPKILYVYTCMSIYFFARVISSSIYSFISQKMQKEICNILHEGTNTSCHWVTRYFPQVNKPPEYIIHNQHRIHIFIYASVYLCRSVMRRDRRNLFLYQRHEDYPLMPPNSYISTTHSFSFLFSVRVLLAHNDKPLPGIPGLSVARFTQTFSQRTRFSLIPLSFLLVSLLLAPSCTDTRSISVFAMSRCYIFISSNFCAISRTIVVVDSASRPHALSFGLHARWGREGGSWSSVPCPASSFVLLTCEYNKRFRGVHRTQTGHWKTWNRRNFYWRNRPRRSVTIFLDFCGDAGLRRCWTPTKKLKKNIFFYSTGHPKFSHVSLSLDCSCVQWRFLSRYRIMKSWT